MKFIPSWAVCLCLIIAAPVETVGQEEPDQHAEEEAGGAIQLSPEERKAAGVTVAPVSQRALSETVRVPGEVVMNAYSSARVTPRIPAQIVARHVRLGDQVKAGQPLVTLSSVEMAEAQGALIVASREWERVQSLGRATVSASRYTEAQVAAQQALATIIAYGLTKPQAEAIAESQDASRATGEFELLAPQDGTVLSDDFIAGELIEPGRLLFTISDESVLWVEAQMGPMLLDGIAAGAPARISVDGESWIEGTVLERHHQLDETTRTQGLRVEIENRGDRLHPGQFVQVELATGIREPILAVPNAAVTMIEGEPTVFRAEDGGGFHAETVQTGPTVGDWTVVHSGLAEGDEIATTGVFHLKSLFLKSSLGEGHAH